MSDKSSQSRKKKKPYKIWVIQVFIITFFLSIAISVAIELSLRHISLSVALVILFILIVINIVSDLIGLAVASAESAPFTAMAARKVKGAKKSLSLLLRAEQVSNICCDVIGDICGIISGATGAFIALQIALMSDGADMVASIVVTGFVSAFTVGGKAMGKRVALHQSAKIVKLVGKALAVFGE